MWVESEDFNVLYEEVRLLWFLSGRFYDFV